MNDSTNRSADGEPEAAGPAAPGSSFETAAHTALLKGDG